MKIKFDHNFGHQEQGEFFHFGCELVDVAAKVAYDADTAFNVCEAVTSLFAIEADIANEA